jgi:hypothetical protein
LISDKQKVRIKEAPPTDPEPEPAAAAAEPVQEIPEEQPSVVEVEEPAKQAFLPSERIKRIK